MWVTHMGPTVTRSSLCKPLFQYLHCLFPDHTTAVTTFIWTSWPAAPQEKGSRVSYGGGQPRQGLATERVSPEGERDLLRTVRLLSQSTMSLSLPLDFSSREFARWKVNSLALERKDFFSLPLPLAPEFIRNIRLLGRRPNLQQVTENLIKKYGTHFLLSATLGGKHRCDPARTLARLLK